MWEATAHVDQSAKVRIAPESAWSLLISAQAWSVRPDASMAFDVADPLRPADLQGPDPGRLRFWVAPGDSRAHAGVLEVTAEAPGHMMRMQAQGGQFAWELSVQPRRGGSVLRVQETWTVERPAKIDAEAQVRRLVKGWLSGLREIAEGRRPLPDGMPQRLHQACVAEPPARPVVEATASTVIQAPPGHVQQLHSALEVVRVTQPENVLYLGPVPGTPEDGQVGGMRYYVSRRANGRLAGQVSLLAASSPGGRVVRFVTPPFGEWTYRYEPAGAGTRLEVSLRCPGKHAGGDDDHREKHAAQLAALADRLKAAIESLAKPGS